MQLSLKTNKQDRSQTDLRSFFTPTQSARSSQSNWSSEKPESNSNSQQATAEMPVKEIISLLESDDEDLSVWNGADDDDDDALMSGKECLGNSCQESFHSRRPRGS